MCGRNKLVSIIVPVFNMEKYVETCILSLERQLYQDIEIILVNDGSTDRSESICDELSSRYSNVKVIHQKNQGLSGARNSGLKQATGEYILFVDADDVVLEHLLIDNIEKMEKKNLDILCFNRYDIHSDRIEIMEEFKNEDENSQEQLRKDILLKKRSHQACGKIYRRKVWDGRTFPAGIVYEDMFVMPEILSKPYKIGAVDKCYFLYNRTNNTSIMHTAGRMHFYWEFMANRQKITYFPRLKDSLQVDMLEQAVYAYTWVRFDKNISRESKDILRQYIKDNKEHAESLASAKARKLLKWMDKYPLLYDIKCYYYRWRYDK